MHTGEDDTTELIRRVRAPDPDGLDRLFSRVYEELRTLARIQRSRWEGDHTLDTTALVHEAYLRLVDASPCGQTRSRPCCRKPMTSGLDCSRWRIDA